MPPKRRPTRPDRVQPGTWVTVQTGPADYSFHGVVRGRLGLIRFMSFFRAMWPARTGPIAAKPSTFVAGIQAVLGKKALGVSEREPKPIRYPQAKLDDLGLGFDEAQRAPREVFGPNIRMSRLRSNCAGNSF
jgi:hypothetical protein